MGKITGYPLHAYGKELGCYSFSPGMSCAYDLMMNFWGVGCRNFRIVGASRFYLSAWRAQSLSRMTLAITRNLVGASNLLSAMSGGVVASCD